MKSQSLVKQKLTSLEWSFEVSMRYRFLFVYGKILLVNSWFDLCYSKCVELCYRNRLEYQWLTLCKNEPDKLKDETYTLKRHILEKRIGYDADLDSQSLI